MQNGPCKATSMPFACSHTPDRTAFVAEYRHLPVMLQTARIAHRYLHTLKLSACDSHHLLSGLCVAALPSVLHPFGRFGALSDLDGLGCCQVAHLHAASGISSCSAALMHTLTLLASSPPWVATYFHSITLLHYLY